MASGVEELLDMLFEMVDEAKNMPLSSDKCVIERDRALDLIDDIRAQFPMELAEAKNAIRQLGLKLEQVHEFPFDGTNHMVIVLRKVSPTPAKFPRRYAKIKASPL